MGPQGDALDFLPDPQFGTRLQPHRRRAIGVIAGLAAIVTTVAAVLAPAALGAPEPGVPVAVAPGVPDNGRAWELVTPPDPVAPQLAPPKALSADGNQVFFTTLGPLPGAPSGRPLVSSNIARRGVAGWFTTPVEIPYPSAAPALFLGQEAFNPALTESIWRSNLPLEPGSAQDVGLFRKTADEQFHLLAAIGEESAFNGASLDLQHVLFTSSKHLLAADATRSQGSSLYEVVGSTLRLVDVADDGSLLSDCGIAAVPFRNAISHDGRRVFFTTAPCGGPARAYLRTDGATTTEISASRCDLPDCGPEAEVSIVGVTPSGSSAFLVTEQRLTDEDSDTRADLYRYDVSSGELTLLSAVPGATELAVLTGSAVASEDGSRVYFRAEDPLIEGAEHLYVADAGGCRLIAPDAEQFVQTSVDGRYAVFATTAALAAGDDDSSRDVYRYDAATGDSLRISAGTAGGNGQLDAKIEPTFPFESTRSHPARAITDDGSEIFFTTAERLLPEDGNQAADVYEWASGSLGLISSGRGDRKAFFLSTTPDGRTALFSTSMTLVPRDRDGGDLDIYVARVGGGFPESSPPACQGDSCRVPFSGGVARAAPKSAAPRAGGIVLRRLDSAACRRIAETGWIALLTEVPRTGRLSAQARARVGRRSRVIASTSVDVTEVGPARLRMRLSREARQALAVGRDLEVRLVLRLAGLRPVRRIGFGLDGSR